MLRILCILSILSLLRVHGQDCAIPFTLPLFGVQVETDVLYGVAPRYNGNMDSLRLDLFKPVGDGQTERPLVVLIHGGGFVNGHRSEMHQLCESLAGMGWAAATISYRLGFYGTGILDPPYAYDAAEFRRATYRAMQDTKGAIRFLKERHEMDSTSMSSVFMVGFSAGGFAALHAAYLDKAEEKPSSAGAIGDVQHFLEFHARPDLGDVDGELNQNGHDPTVMGVVSIFGGLLDTAYIESAGDPALYMYHQSGDPVVGCGVQQPYWGIPFGPSGNYPWVHGSCSIDQHVQQLGYPEGHYHFTLHQGIEHDIHDPPGVLLESLQWMRELFCGSSTHVQDRSTPGKMMASPNPTSGTVRLSGMEQGMVMLELFDQQGQLMDAIEASGPDLEWDLTHVPAGTYLLRSSSDSGVRVTRLIVH